MGALDLNAVVGTTDGDFEGDVDIAGALLAMGTAKMKIMAYISSKESILLLTRVIPVVDRVGDTLGVAGVVGHTGICWPGPQGKH